MQKKSKKQALLDAAAFVLSKNPGASLEEVATQASVGRATLYRYFPKREDLIHELTLESIKEMEKALEPTKESKDSKQILEEILENVIPLGDRFHFLLYEAVSRDPDVEKAENYQIEVLYEFMRKMKSEGLIAPDISEVWGLYVLDALIWAAWSAIQEGDMARNQAKSLTMRTFLTGFSQQK